MPGRREFLGTMAGAAGASLAGQTRQGEMPMRTLGGTGEKISAIGLGGFHIGTPESYADSERLIRTAIDGGITFMDNCWDYHDGKSEEWMGRALQDGYRERVFLMTKIDGRDAKTAARQIDESLARLKTDIIDLMQFHEIIRISEPHQVFSPDGAAEAMLEAKEAGKIRYIGFTGHKDPKIHLWMLQKADEHGFALDAVQMPLNVMDAHYESFEKQVLPKLVEKQIGVLGMKPLGGGLILESDAKVTPAECLHYAMSLPTSVVITGCETLEQVEQALGAGRTFQEFDEKRRQELLTKTADPSQNGEFELYKTSRRFDGTYENPQWLG